MGHRGGFRAGIGLTQHHQGAVLGRGPHPIEGRQAHQWIGGGHPPKPQLTALHGLHLGPHIKTRLRGNRPPSQAPVAFQLNPVVSNSDAAIPRQQLGQAPRLAATHGIGLASEREGTGTSPANLTS